MFASTGFAPSQGFGAGQGVAQTQSPGKAPRPDEKQAVLPVTVRCVETAVADRAASGGELCFFGTDAEAQFIVLLGVAEAVDSQAASVDFVLNDATGRIKTRMYSAAEQDSSAIVAGRYIQVVGSVRTSPALHVVAQWVRSVMSPDEISYHAIEVAYSGLKLKAGPKPAMELAAKVPSFTSPMKTTAKLADSPGSDPMPSFTPDAKHAAAPEVAAPAAAAPAAAAPAPVAAAPVANSAQLNAKVLDVVKAEAEGNEAGMHISQVLEKMAPASEAEVRKTLRQLVEAGDLFTTLDDDHFAPL